MKKIVCFIVLMGLLSGCTSVTTEPFGPQYSGYTAGYGYSGGTPGGLTGLGNYGGWTSSYYAPSPSY